MRPKLGRLSVGRQPNPLGDLVGAYVVDRASSGAFRVIQITADFTIS
jgi:hypothetical protein